MIVKRSIIIWSFFDAIFKRSHHMTCELAQCNESNSLHCASCYFSVSFHHAPITPYENFCEEKLCFSMCHSEIILRCLSSSLVLRNKEYVAQWTSSKNWIKIGIHSLTHSLTHFDDKNKWKIIPTDFATPAFPIGWRGALQRIVKNLVIIIVSCLCMPKDITE